MISTESRLRLAAKARLRFDRKSSRYMLLYPERGLVLNESAAAVVALLTGEYPVEAIVTRLSARYPSADPRDLERDVVALLGRLRKRRLLDTV